MLALGCQKSTEQKRQTLLKSSCTFPPAMLSSTICSNSAIVFSELLIHTKLRGGAQCK